MRTIAPTTQPTTEDLGDIALFATVVEEKSFTAAARKAGISKSSLSARIARLEKRAGVRLLHRTTRRVSLTDAGAQLYPKSARLAAEAGEAARALVRLTDDVEREVRGVVRVSADTNLGRSIIPLAAHLSCLEHPGLQIELVCDDAFVDVVHGGYDLVIRIARKLQPGIVGRKLARSDEIVVAAPRYIAERGAPVTPDDLHGHRCLRYRFRDPKTEWRFITPRGVKSVDATGPFIANHDPPLIAAAVAGLGIAVMARFAVQAELDSGALVEIMRDQRIPPVGIWALHPWRRSAPPRVRAVVDAIAVTIRRSRGFRPP